MPWSSFPIVNVPKTVSDLPNEKCVLLIALYEANEAFEQSSYETNIFRGFIEILGTDFIKLNRSYTNRTLMTVENPTFASLVVPVVITNF